jgi:hypothetical protein
MLTKFGRLIERADLDLVKISVGGQQPLPKWLANSPDFTLTLNGGPKQTFLKNTSRGPMAAAFGMAIRRMDLDF